MDRLVEGGRHGLAMCKECVQQAAPARAEQSDRCCWCGISFGDRPPERIHTFVGYPEHTIRVPEGPPAEPREIRGRLICHNCL